MLRKRRKRRPRLAQQSQSSTLISADNKDIHTYAQHSSVIVSFVNGYHVHGICMPSFDCGKRQNILKFCLTVIN